MVYVRELLLFMWSPRINVSSSTCRNIVCSRVWVRVRAVQSRRRARARRCPGTGLYNLKTLKRVSSIAARDIPLTSSSPIHGWSTDDPTWRRPICRSVNDEQESPVTVRDKVFRRGQPVLVESLRRLIRDLQISPLGNAVGSSPRMYPDLFLSMQLEYKTERMSLIVHRERKFHYEIYRVFFSLLELRVKDTLRSSVISWSLHDTLTSRL